MTTPNSLDNPHGTLLPRPQRRQRRPGRRRRKRPTSTDPTPNVQEQSSADSRRPVAGEPSYDFRLSAEEKESTLRPEKLLKSTTHNYKIHRKPYNLARKDSESESTNADSRSDLKSLLKQAGGRLSLSEVLQQKNLSLSDLLSKKQHALAALSKPEPATTQRMDLNSGEMMMTGEDDQDMTKKRRVPMFVAMPPHVYPTEELRPPPVQTATPVPSTTEANHPQRHRIPIVSPNSNGKPIKEVVPRIRPDFSNSRRPTTDRESNATASTPIRPIR